MVQMSFNEEQVVDQDEDAMMLDGVENRDDGWR